MKEIKKLLLIGAAGGLARKFVKKILNVYPELQIVAIDSRKMSINFNDSRVKSYTLRYRRGEFENLFRTYKFDSVLFLSRVTHSSIDSNLLKKRLNLTLEGTSTILNLCAQYEIKRLSILSTFHVYGALHDNSIFLYEDAPLKASLKHPELRDVVEMDQRCETWMYQNKDNIDTVILRSCNIIGPSVRNGITKFLKSSMSFYPMDYNPSLQFVHEEDLIRCLIASLSKLPTGVYNCAPPEIISVKDAVETINHNALSLPLFAIEVMNKVMKRTQLLGVPEYLIDYLKYPCVLSNIKLLNELQEDFFKYSTKEALKSLKSS